MRIIHILNSPNWSGASSYCVNLCAQQLGLGHEVLLLTEPGKPRDRAGSMQIPCDDSIRLNHRNPYLYLHAYKRMRDLFLRFRPDVISSHINEGAWMAGMVAREFVPEATVIRTRSDIDPPKGHFINWLVHFWWTDHLIVSSNQHKLICQRVLQFPGDGIDVVYGAIDPQAFRPDPEAGERFRREQGISADTVLICMIARLDPVKGHEYALQALKLLGSCPVPRRMVFLGYENQRTIAWLENLATELGVRDRILVLGFQPDLHPVLSACDIGVVASIGSEANCRVALEFMSSGKPVVATRVGVIPEIIFDGEQGFLVPPRDAMAMAQALVKLLNNVPARLIMGKKAREHILANFPLDLFLRRTETVYEKARARRAEKRRNPFLQKESPQ
jgi:glycosyltransferase involved in cell wall biosynthesis